MTPRGGRRRPLYAAVRLVHELTTMMMMMLRLVLISDISDKDVAKHKELLYMRRCRSKAARGVRACAGDSERAFEKADGHPACQIARRTNSSHGLIR